MGKAWPALELYVPSCDPELVDLLLAELDDFHPTAIQELDTPQLRVFFNTATERDAAARAVASSFGIHVLVHGLDVEDEDWAARSQAELRAITVGRIAVCPPWDVVPASAVVVIRPSMGFGTGHHATTRLMLLAIQHSRVDGQLAFDLGCGSGVLALAAARLGAQAAVGIDVDRDAVENARENARLNDLHDRVRFEVADFRDCSSRAAVVMANLTGGLLERSAAKLAALVEPGGELIVSGFMESEKPRVLAAFEQLLWLEKIDQQEEWVSAMFHKSRQM